MVNINTTNNDLSPSLTNTLMTTICDIGNPGLAWSKVQQYDGVKPVNMIPTLPS